MGALSGKAVSLPLGGCDAFFSHSWRDHAVLKWEALSKWAAAFHEAEARTPTIWLDKVLESCFRGPARVACARASLYHPLRLLRPPPL